MINRVILKAENNSITDFSVKETVYHEIIDTYLGKSLQIYHVNSSEQSIISTVNIPLTHDIPLMCSLTKLKCQRILILK
jgi:hypothetical protein